MEKTKLLTIAVVGLLILNFGLLSFLWFGNGQERVPQGANNGRGQSKALEFLMKELHFDAQQRAICDTRLLKHRFLMDSLSDASRTTHDRLFDHLKIGDTTGVALLGEIQRQKQLEVFNYFHAIRTVCKEEQKSHFDRIIYDAMRMLRPQH
jgi:hypothetical protein